MMHTNLKVTYEKPNPYLYTFTGTIILDENTKIPCDNSNFLLRGSSLRNTEWVYGLACYTGIINLRHDTKIMLNSVKAETKKSTLERKMNREIYVIFIVQLVLCLLSGILYVLWTTDHLVSKTLNYNNSK